MSNLPILLLRKTIILNCIYSPFDSIVILATFVCVTSRATTTVTVSLIPEVY